MATTLKGASQLRTALRKFEPDLAKELQDEMAAFLKPIVQKARGYVPSDFTPSHWRGETKTGKWPIYNASLMRRGIGYKTTPSRPNRRGFSYAASIANKTASGAIFETAGRKNPGGMMKAPKGTPRTNKNFSHSNNPQAGAQFIRALENASPIAQGNTRTGSGRRGRYMKGRLIYRAWAEDQGKTNAAIIKALEGAANKFRARVG
jgi:plasmid stabilization system protein ParE